MEDAYLVRRTSLGDFVRDLISLIQEQVELAKADPALQQNGAVVVCSDAVSIMRIKLAEDEILQARCMLATGIFDAHWRSEWDALANAKPNEFSIKADKLLVDARLINIILTHTEQNP